ncbi:Ribonuclease P protein subunit p20 [Portunus trituberculatus]|uniref:Ribonuclease P protein subunit p20 n=1 Tax=Portunus trituberculatus TaxID=210409 RepID=A0A5B7E7J7_PORTR|nr:Ribonuclease P protein subunit p20 [Portunus trituberculatus]
MKPCHCSRLWQQQQQCYSHVMATEQKYVSSSSSKNSSSSSIDPREQWLRQQLPRHLPKRLNDLYLDQNSNFKSQQQRALSLLGESGWVVVHGLGQAIPHAINLSLSLQAAANCPASLHTNTSSIFLPEAQQNHLTAAVVLCDSLENGLTAAVILCGSLEGI